MARGTAIRPRCCRALLPCHLNGVSLGFTYRADDLITLILGCCGFRLVSYHTWLELGTVVPLVYFSDQSGVPSLRRIRSVIFVVCATTAFRGNMARRQYLDSSRTHGTDAILAWSPTREVGLTCPELQLAEQQRSILDGFIAPRNSPYDAVWTRGTPTVVQGTQAVERRGALSSSAIYLLRRFLLEAV
jgi:hypothetical protein